MLAQLCKKAGLQFPRPQSRRSSNSSCISCISRFSFLAKRDTFSDLWQEQKMKSLLLRLFFAQILQELSNAIIGIVLFGAGTSQGLKRFNDGWSSPSMPRWCNYIVKALMVTMRMTPPMTLENFLTIHLRHCRGGGLGQWNRRQHHRAGCWMRSLPPMGLGSCSSRWGCKAGIGSSATVTFGKNQMLTSDWSNDFAGSACSCIDCISCSRYSRRVVGNDGFIG